MSVARLALALVLSTSLSTSLARAQDSTAAAARAPSRWMFGGSVGLPGYERETVPELFTLAAHWTYLRPNVPGADVSLGVAPRLLADGVLAGGARVGLALPLALGPDAFVLPSAGVSLLGAFGPDESGTLAGVNAGGALVLRGAGDVGLRLGVTWHWLDSGSGAPWLLEVGVVRLPARVPRG
jgi:hypothetical protein